MDPQKRSRAPETPSADAAVSADAAAPACCEAYSLDAYEPTRGLGMLLGRLRGELLTTIDRELAADERLASLDMTAAQLIIIANLAADKEPRCASDLCKGISYDAGAMTRMLDRLESKGLLRRERAASDRRLVYLELTEQGRELYPVMKDISRRVLNRFLEGFEPHEVQQLEGYMRRMLANA